MPSAKPAKLSQVTSPDPRNANLGTDRGRAMLARSLSKLGAGRSILADKNMTVLAGNKTREAAIALGMEDVIIVPTDGKKLVIVQRTDLDLSTDAEAKELAIADNVIAAEDLNLDPEILEEIGSEVDLSDWFPDEDYSGLEDYGSAAAEDFDDEQQGIGGDRQPDRQPTGAEPEEEPQQKPKESYPLAVVLTWGDWQRWRDIKAEVGIKKDSQAMVRAIDALEVLKNQHPETWAAVFGKGKM